MRRKGTFFAWALLAGACGLLQAQQDTVPLYNVTVIEHSLQAVNYQYRSGPTEIDFRGTVLLGKAKGHATVESFPGRTEIDAKLQGLTSPQGFGKEYLTYVLWAISPEGAAHNLGEVVPNGSNSAHLRVTTDLQAFGLLVTAEPYAAVRQPSNVVVMENQVRPETIGKTEPIIAKAELLPRGHYVLDKRKSEALLNSDAPKVSMAEYEQISQIYQAENALGLARAVNADTLAADTFAKAQHLLEDAKRKRENKAGASFVIQAAREAAQTADDARVIALKRAQEEKVATAEQRVAAAEQAAQQARAEAEAARAQAEAERAARERVESARVETVPVAPPPPPVATAPAEPPAPVRREAQDAVNSQKQMRLRLLAQLRGVAETRDTPRGLVLVIGDAEFRGANLSSGALAELTRIAQIVAPTGLQVTVEGNSDSSAGQELSERRAEAVRDALVNGGLRMSSITARGLGNTRPTTSNATEAGRIANRRVEIAISGGQIGDTPLWDRSYSLSSR
jgi:outer membrane protein OmpA-like peptidoglycan-associated protein